MGTLFLPLSFGYWEKQKMNIRERRKTCASSLVTAVLIFALVNLFARVHAADSDARYEWFVNEAGNKWGLMDVQSGKVIFRPRFAGGTGRREGERLGTDLHHGRAWVFEGDKIELVDVQGHILARIAGSMVRLWTNDLYQIETPSGYGLYSDLGNVVLPARCSQISDLSDGMAVIGVWGPGPPTPTSPPLYGYIDENGSIVIPPTLAKADPFSEGVALVCDHGYRFIDKTGKLVFSPPSSLAYPFSAGLSAAYMEKTGWGFINRTGSWVVQPKYEDVFLYFKDGRGWAGVPSDERRVSSKGWVFIDEQGHELTSPDYGKPPFNLSDEVGTGKSNSFGVNQREELETGGLFRSWGNMGIIPHVGLLSRDGKVVCPNRYTRISDFVGTLAEVEAFDGSIWRRGLINLQGQEVLPLGAYDQIIVLPDETAQVSKEGKKALVNKSGGFMAPFQ